EDDAQRTRLAVLDEEDNRTVEVRVEERRRGDEQLSAQALHALLPGGRLGENRREALEHPALVELPPPIRLAREKSEVPGAWIHGQPRLDRVVEVVALDQLVDRGEAPAPGDPPPAAGEHRFGGGAPGELAPGPLEPALVLLGLQLDLAQAPHVCSR